MRKLFAVITGTFFVAGGLAAATVTVTKPAANETWFKGQVHQIVWTKSGDMPDLVRISLWNKTATTQVKLIADNQPNSGSYSWSLLPDVPDGQYVVRVKVKNVAVHDDSGVFNVATASGPSITVTKPAAGNKWNRDKTYDITWTKIGTMPNSVKIDLLNSAGIIIVKPIADGVPNSGSYSWTVPAATAFGDYRVRVQVKTSQVQDSSEIFSVAVASQIPVPQKAPSLVTPPLKVIYPHDNSVATAGSILSIKFSTNRDSGTVEILLYDESKSHKIADIAQQVAFGQGQQCPPVGPDSPNQYVYNWEVPYAESFMPGTFTLRIHCYESGIIAWSDKFKIIWPMKEHEYEFEAAVANKTCVKDPEGLAPPPTRPRCEQVYVSGRANVGWDVFDYVGDLGITPPYWRVFVQYAQLKFPLEQFMGKNTALIKAQLRIKKICTSNINTTRASAAHLVSRLREALPQGGMVWAQCQAMQTESVYILPDNLTEASYNVESTVQDWILQREPNHGFLISPANTDPPYYAAQTCLSVYTVKLYIKIQEEFKGHD